MLAAALVYFYGREMTRNADEALDKRAGAIATGVANECEYGLLVGNNSLVQQAAVKALAQPDVLSAVVFNHAGKIVATAGQVDVDGTSREGPELVSKYNSTGAIEVALPNSRHADAFFIPVYLHAAPDLHLEVDDSSSAAAEEAGRKLGLVELTVSRVSTDAAVARARLIAIEITSLLVVVVSFVKLLLVRHMVKPLRSLVAGTEHLAQGNLQTRVAISRNDEIGDLTKAFNKMADRLQESRTEILEHQRTLEQRVRERTIDLEREIAERERAQVALSEQARLSQLGADVGVALTHGDTMRSMLQTCTEAIVGHLDAAFARIWTLSEDQSTLELQASAGMYTHIDGGHARVPVGKFKIGLIAQERKPHLTNAVVGDPRVPVQEWAKREGLVAFAGYPLIVGNQLVGVLAMFSRKTLTDFTLKSLASVADGIALGIARKQSEETLRESELRYHSLFENMLEGFAYCKMLYEDDRPKDFVYIEVNGAFEKLTGLKNVVGRSVTDVIPGIRESDPGVLEVYGRVASTGEPERFERYSNALRAWFAVSVYSPQKEYFVAVFDNVTERKRADEERETMHRRLLEVSREAGMAEVATNVLHNVGNVLNSVNVCASLVSDKIRHSKALSLSKAAALLRGHAADLAQFLSTDPKGKQLPAYFEALAAHLDEERTALLKELASLTENVNHIKEIVAMQQSYGKRLGVLELLPVIGVVDDALRLNEGALARHQVKVIREYEEIPPMLLERHKVLQILVNLIRNGKYALDEGGGQDRQLTIRVGKNGGDTIKVAVVDNGIGIPAENLTRIFGHGFTTRKDGHGFGLHSSALAAKEMGGSLAVHSDGVDRGATFTLELPVDKGQHNS